MINYDDIKSGFDIEMIVSPKIFDRLTNSMYDAHEIPHTVVMPLTNELKKVTRPTVKFDNYKVPNTNGIISDLTINFDLTSDSGTIEISVFCEIDVKPGHKENSEKVDSLDLSLRYITFRTDGITWDPEQATIKPVADIFEKALNQTYHTTAVPGIIQRIETKIFGNDNETGKKNAFGIYVNLLLKQKDYPYEEMDYSKERGNPELGINFLPEGLDYAFGVNPSVFNLAASHFKIEMFARYITEPAEEESEETEESGSGEKKSSEEKVIVSYTTDYDDYSVRCKDVGIFPGSLTPSENFHNKLLFTLNLNVYVKDADLNVDVDVTFLIYPELNGDDLTLKVELWDIDTDVSLWESIRSLLSGKSLISILSYILFPAATITIFPFIFWGVSNLVANKFSEAGEILGAKKLKFETSKLAGLFDFLNNRITFFRKRLSPFYYTDFQVEIKWSEFNVDQHGIIAGGIFQNSEQYIPKEQYVTRGEEVKEELVISGKTRINRDESDINGLIYRISDYETIFENDKINRPDPDKLDEFWIDARFLSDMIQENKLACQVQLIPDAIHLHNNKIRAIRFHSGLVLSPNEAGTLQYTTLSLIVMGYKLIRKKHKLEFYYRSKRDLSERNNLMSLPNIRLDL
jgi:hypothetical protein